MKIIRRLKRIFTTDRYLLFSLALKNLKIQYKYAFLGFLWAFFVPLCMALIFWFLFSFVFQRPIPPLSIVTALFVWQFVNLSVMGATTSIIDNVGILKKVYFPKEIVPLSVVFSNFINFLLSMAVLLVLVIIYDLYKGVTPLLPHNIIFLPGIIGLTLLLTLGLVLITSCLQVFYRDVRYIVEVSLMVWFYLSGIFYDVDQVARGAQAMKVTWVTKLFMINPLYDLLVMYRSAILPKSVTGMVVDVTLYYSPLMLIIQTLVIIVSLFFIAYAIFMSKEDDLIDYI